MNQKKQSQVTIYCMANNDIQKSENTCEYYLENDTKITKNEKTLKQMLFYFDLESFEIIYMTH